MSNILIMHGGAPTAVINSSLAGVLTQIKQNKFKGKILAAEFGSDGLIKEEFIDLTNIKKEQIEKVKVTPGSAIGTSRYPLSDDDFIKISKILKKHDIKYVLVNGGNGSMDTCGRIAKACDNDIYVVGIPKTIDNDICEIDHAPGYASAARYLAQSVREAICDISSLPIHVSIIESMGRNSGWLTAAAALSEDENGNYAPDMILLPEHPFDEQEFLSNVKKILKKKSGICIVASEGLKYKDGTPIVKPVFKVGRATYFGDVSSHLRDLIIKNLHVKARSEKPGLLQRCSEYVSEVDRKEAFEVGKEAVKAVLNKKTKVMVGIKRVSTKPYKIQTALIPIDKVMLKESMFPKKYMNKNKTNVTKEFIDWARPLVGNLPKYESFVIKK